MKEIPQQEEALRFTIDSVLWKAKVKPEPRSEAVRMAITSLALVRRFAAGGGESS